jgi:UDP-glucose 4-epimerase
MSLSSRPTIAVTGAAGLIGSALVRALRARGARVVACDDFSIGTWRHADEDIVWESGDVSDPALVGRLGRHGVEAVVHAAAHPGGRSLEVPSDNVRVNVLGSLRIFEWCARARIPVVFLSSSAVYGEQPAAPIPETAPLRPGTIYAVGKVACEQALPILAEGYGLPWTVLRLFATYGAGHRPSTVQGIVNVVLTQLLRGGEVIVKGSLDRVRDLVDVEDAAEAIVHALWTDAARGRILNVGTGTGTTVRALLATLAELLGRSPHSLAVRQEPPTVGDPRYSVADVTQMTALGWRAAVPLHEGLRRLVEARRAPGLVQERA